MVNVFFEDKEDFERWGMPHRDEESQILKALDVYGERMECDVARAPVYADRIIYANKSKKHGKESSMKIYLDRDWGFQPNDIVAVSIMRGGKSYLPIRTGIRKVCKTGTGQVIYISKESCKCDAGTVVSVRIIRLGRLRKSHEDCVKE